MPSPIEECRDLFDTGKYTECIERLRDYLDMEPADIIARKVFAAALSQHGNHVEAAVEFLKLAKCEPKEPSHLYNLGRVFEASGEPDKAREFYRKANLMKPGYRLAADGFARLTRASKDTSGSRTQVGQVQPAQQETETPQRTSVLHLWFRRRQTSVATLVLAWLVLAAGACMFSARLAYQRNWAAVARQVETNLRTYCMTSKGYSNSQAQGVRVFRLAQPKNQFTGEIYAVANDNGETRTWYLRNLSATPSKWIIDGEVRCVPDYQNDVWYLPNR